MTYPASHSYVSFSGILLLAEGFSKVFRIVTHPAALPQLPWVMFTRLLHCEYLEISAEILSRFLLLHGAALSIPSGTHGRSHIPFPFADIWNE